MENNKNEKDGGKDVGKDDGKDSVEFNWENDPAKNGPGVSEGIKRLLTTGISAVLMSEEGVRTYLRDMNLPKDALGSMIKGVSKSKEEIISRVGNEFSKLVEKIDIVEELTKFLRENKIKVSAEIEFSKKNVKTDE